MTPRRRKADTPRSRRARGGSVLGALLVIAAIVSLVVQIATNRDDTGTLKTQQAQLLRAQADIRAQASRVDALQVAQGLSARDVVRRTCRQLNTTRRSLRIIIRRGDRNLRSFLREGTISPAQYRRAVMASREARDALGDADCGQLAATIPIS